MEKIDFMAIILVFQLSTKEKAVSELQNSLLQSEVASPAPLQQADNTVNDSLRSELVASQETVSILG